MKTLKLLLLLTALVFAVACKKKSDHIDRNVLISVLTVDGKNLLSAPALYNTSNISVYHIVDGQPQLYAANQFGNNPYVITGSPGYEKLLVYLDFDLKHKVSKTLTLLKIGNSKMDTLEGEFSFEDGAVMLKKVSFNGIPKDRAFNVLK